jgi:hypothetical protein
MRLKFISLLLFALFVFPPFAFAADFQASGKILDSNNNPVSQGIIVFLDGSGKTVAAATADNAGRYQIVVPQGTYTISVEGPKGAGLQKIELKGKTISSPTILDFTLNVPQTFVAKKSSFLQTITPALIIFSIIIIIIGVVYLFWRKKRTKVLPQASSSD